MSYRRTPAVQARLDAQRCAVLEAAAGLLAEDGYRGCSIASVATRAGVAAGTVYLHFASKGALIAEVFRSLVGREVAAVRAAVAGESDGPAMVTAVIETFAGRAMKSPRLAYALLSEPVDPVVDALRSDFRIEFRNIIAAAVTTGVEAGSLPPQNPALVAAALVGAIGEALVGPLAAGQQEPETVPTLILFAHRSLGALNATYA